MVVVVEEYLWSISKGCELRVDIWTGMSVGGALCQRVPCFWSPPVVRGGIRVRQVAWLSLSP